MAGPPPTPEQQALAKLFLDGVALHKQGNLAAAQQAYEQVLAKQPGHFDALHLRGVVAYQTKNLAAAIELIAQALNIKSDSAIAHNNLGNPLKDLGRFAEALASYDKAIAIRPDYAIAHFNRGVTLGELKRFDEALVSYDKALAIQPSYPDAYFNRGNALRALKRFSEALASYERAIALKPDLADAYSNRGDVLQALKRFDEAVASYDRAIALAPNDAATHSNRGSALRELGRFDEALASYDKALAIEPDQAETLGNRGQILCDLRRYEDALASCDRAIAVKDELAEAWLARGNVCWHLRRYEDALTSYDKAIALRSELAQAWLGRGNVLYDLRRYEDALAGCERAIALNADLAEAWLARGNVYCDLGRPDEALASYDRAIAIRPDVAEVWLGRGNVFANLKRHNEAFAAYDKALALAPDLKSVEGMRLREKMHDCNWDKIGEEIAHLSRSIADGKISCTPITLLALTDSPDEHLLCARSWVSNTLPAVGSAPRTRRASPRARIRLAYLSADFRSHPVAQALVNIVELHDRSRFEVIGLSIGPQDDSDLGKRVINALDGFHDLTQKSDRAAAAFIEELDIDILSKTAVWTEFSRPGILAYRPSPIQVNFFAPYTSGADFFDYIVAAPQGILPHERHHYLERVAYVPGFANDATQPIANVRPMRREQGLPEDAFVFSCFNAYYKLHPHTFGTLMNILRRVDRSVLWLTGSPSGIDNLRKEASARDVDPARLVFAAHVPSMADHLARAALADLFLDTLPQGAHTTARDALYAGVPVVTRTGKTFVGRIGAIQLDAVGLPELITTSDEEYENLAVELAKDRARLQAIREKLARNKPAARLFNSELYVRDLEAVYAAMYRRYLAGLPPDHIELAV